MGETLRLLKGFRDFAAIYCFDKCIRTMVAGMAMLLLICIIRKCNRRHTAHINIGAMTLLLPMAFMGMNKLFFRGYFFVLLNGLYAHIHKAVYGNGDSFSGLHDKEQKIETEIKESSAA